MATQQKLGNIVARYPAIAAAMPDWAEYKNRRAALGTTVYGSDLENTQSRRNPMRSELGVQVDAEAARLGFRDLRYSFTQIPVQVGSASFRVLIYDKE